MVAGYEVLRRLSEGASAEVFLARSSDSQRQVIIEVLKSELSMDEEQVKRFLDTSRQRRLLEHPHLARRVLEGIGSDGRPYSITETDGDSLAACLAAQGPFSLEALLPVAIAVCEALHFLHQKGVVHGNLKPATVYLSSEGGAVQTRVVDWSLALMRTARTLPGIDDGALVEAEYLSPERIRGQRASPASDVYGAGLLIHELLTGAPPFCGGDSEVVRSRQLDEAPPGLPAHAGALGSIVRRCLAKAPSDRYPTAAALRDALAAVARGEAPAAAVAVEFQTNLLDGSVETGQALGNYELLEPLGEGALGRVFLARHSRLGHTVALRLLKPEHAQNKQELARFIQEATAVGQLEHPHIAGVREFVEEPQRVYCVIDLLRGDTLAALQRKGPLALPRVVDLAGQVASALEAAHGAGVVHRDLNPDNIFVTEDQGGDLAQVTDFGAARLRGPQAGVPASSGVIGTPAFMPPEQALGQSGDHRVDVYSLGVVLYRAVVGKVPFMADSFEKLVERQSTNPAPPLPATSKAGEPVPEALRTLVAACLEKDPQQRPATMAEVRAALERLQQELTGAAASTKPRWAQWLVKLGRTTRR